MAERDLVIRPATLADAPNAAGLHRAAAVLAYRDIFPPSEEPPTLEWLTANWTELVSNPDGALVATLGDELAGTVVARTDPQDPTVAQLHRLYVVPERWATGVGAALHDAALDRMRARGFTHAGLWVLERNVRARRFYEARGWRHVPGRTMGYPGTDVVEVRYERDL